MESEEDFKIKIDIDIETVKESLEKIKEYMKDMKKNHQYCSYAEQDAIQNLELYINDSTPKQAIRDKIKELEKKTEMAEGEELLIFDAKIDVLKELLGE